METWGEIINLLWDIFILRLLWRHSESIWKLGQEPRKKSLRERARGVWKAFEVTGAKENGQDKIQWLEEKQGCCRRRK